MTEESADFVAEADIELLLVEQRQLFESSNLNEVVAELTLKPTIFDSDPCFSEQEENTTRKFEKPIKVLKAKAASSLFSPSDVPRSRELLKQGRRFRKNYDQLKYLVNEYRKKPNWTQKECQRIAETLSLSLHQVYKWMWDQQKKVQGTLGESLQK